MTLPKRSGGPHCESDNNNDIMDIYKVTERETIQTFMSQSKEPDSCSRLQTHYQREMYMSKVCHLLLAEIR